MKVKTEVRGWYTQSPRGCCETDGKILAESERECYDLSMLKESLCHGEQIVRGTRGRSGENSAGVCGPLPSAPQVSSPPLSTQLSIQDADHCDLSDWNCCDAGSQLGSDSGERAQRSKAGRGKARDLLPCSLSRAPWAGYTL